MNLQNNSDKPLLLVSINSLGKLMLHSEAASFICSLPAPISVATVIGPAKTGKSFLLSQVISQPHISNLSTLGLWVWSRPMLAYNAQGKVASILLLDSQGFLGGENERQRLLLSLILLFSNCLLYNSIGPLDSISFEELETVMEVARELRGGACEFHWILRDFEPNLVDSFGLNITPTQYMENKLLEVEGHLAQNALFTLKQKFSSRSCQFFSKPTPGYNEQPPQFLKQIIQLRKKLNGISSFSLDGNALLAVIESYVQSLNAGDSLTRANQEGNDCKMRFQCLGRLGQQLRQLEQRKSSNQIEGVQEHLSQIKIHLKEYYKQRMCSHRQIQTLDQQLNQIIEDFQEISQIPTAKISPIREAPRLSIPRPEKITRLSLSVSQQDRGLQFQSRPTLSITRINTAKSLQNKLQDFQTRVYRYELEAACSKKQLQVLREQCDKSKIQLQNRTDQVEELLQKMNLRQKEFNINISALGEQLQQAKKQKMLAQSELQKLAILSKERIQHLEDQAEQAAAARTSEMQRRQERYRSKFGQYAREIEELKKSHEDQLTHLKQIYKSNQDQLFQFHHAQKSQTFYKEMREQMNLLQSTKQELERQKFSRIELLQINTRLRREAEHREETHKEALQQLARRGREAQRRLQEVHCAVMQSKNRILEDLQLKIENNAKVKEQQIQIVSQIRKENQRLIYQIRQKDVSLSQISASREVANNKIFKLNKSLEDLQRKYQEIILQNLKKEDQQLKLRQKLQFLKERYGKIQEQLAEKLNLIQKYQYENANLKGEISVLQQTQEFQISSLKEKYELQLGDLKGFFEGERNRLNIRIKELQTTADNYRKLRQDYEDLQHQTAEAEFNLQEELDKKESQLQTARLCLSELALECENLNQKNVSLRNELVKMKEEATLNFKTAAQNDWSEFNKLQEALKKSLENNTEKQKTIMIVRQQLQRENKSHNIKIDQLQKQIDQKSFKFLTFQSQHLKQIEKGKIMLQESQKDVLALNQQVAILTHKLSLQEKSLNYRVEAKITQTSKLSQKLKQIQINYTASAKQNGIIREQLKAHEQQILKLKKLISIFFKQKQIAIQNAEEQINRARLTQRRYQSHLNLFQEKIGFLKEQNTELRVRIDQYIRDYKILEENKIILETSLERQVLLSKNRMELLSKKQ